ncbi:MAG: cell division protein ZapA [bacterium]|nr:cell division protein ZapA [bacterium]
MKQKTYVRVAGKEVALISEDDPAYLRRVAAYVDRKLNETAAAMRMSVPSATVLTAIALGDELMRAQDENQRLRRELLALREQAAQKKEP